jgi:hypothetical protein
MDVVIGVNHAAVSQVVGPGDILSTGIMPVYGNNVRPIVEAVFEGESTLQQ